MENYTKKLVEYISTLEFENIPEDVTEQTKLYILDYYASSFAGYRVNQYFNTAVLEITKEMGGCEQSSILLAPCKYPVANAAYMNAIYAHGADLDDGNRKAAGHIGTHVISTVFAMAEHLDSLWSDVIVAINVGYDVFNRIAGAAQPGLYIKGFHSTGVAGTIACAAACSKLMQLGSKKIYNAMSLAAIQSSGLIIIDESGQCCKPINPANAARIGIISSFLAKKGVESSKNPLESSKGWFHAFSDHVDESILLDGLGEKFTISESYLKLYPTCRHTHSCIDAAIELRNKLHVDDSFNWFLVDDIRVMIYPSAIKSAGNIRYPKTVDEAKFSLSYALAVALVKGQFLLSDLIPAFSSEIRFLIEKMVLIADERMEDRYKGIRGCCVKVTFSNGEIVTQTVLVPKGEGSKILNWSDIENKIQCCSDGIIKPDIIRQLICNCKNIAPQHRFETINKVGDMNEMIITMQTMPIGGGTKLTSIHYAETYNEVAA